MTGRKMMIEAGGMERAPKPLEFAYFIYNNGTESDKTKDLERLSALMSMDYIGFTENFDRKIMVYRPFRLGIRQNGNDPKRYKTDFYWEVPGSPGEV